MRVSVCLVRRLH